MELWNSWTSLAGGARKAHPGGVGVEARAPAPNEPISPVSDRNAHPAGVGPLTTSICAKQTDFTGPVEAGIKKCDERTRIADRRRSLAAGYGYPVSPRAAWSEKRNLRRCPSCVV